MTPHLGRVASRDRYSGQVRSDISRDEAEEMAIRKGARSPAKISPTKAAAGARKTAPAQRSGKF